MVKENVLKFISEQTRIELVPGAQEFLDSFDEETESIMEIRSMPSSSESWHRKI